MQHDDSFSGRDIIIAAAGIAIGVLGSRLLAPVIAMGSGAIKSRSTGDPFALLEEDHRLILETLRSMEELAEDAGSGKRMALFLTLKRKLGKHALAEEDVVYPLLNDEAQRRDAARHLYEEHAQIKMLLFDIEMAIMRAEPWRGPVSNLRSLIERHVREEEDEQFPRLREVLSEQRFSEVAAQVHREEALIL